MAAWLGSYGTAAFGEQDLPQAGAVIMQYTGHNEFSESDPPTYACVGENDGIANWHTMEARLNRLNEFGIPTEFHHYTGLRHWFRSRNRNSCRGLDKEAVDFWETQINGG